MFWRFKTMNISRRLLLSGSAAFMLTPASTSATELGKPAGEVILSVEGKITQKNSGEIADFDLAMLEAMPKTVFKTTTPWTEGEAEFEGVALKEILAVTGAQGRNLDAVALNDYAAPLPASDAEVAGAIVAYKLNGEYMPVRSKGPLWIVYPFDQKPELKTETIYSRSVWQLRKITVKE
jgi:hypothetical protein